MPESERSKKTSLRLGPPAEVSGMYICTHVCIYKYIKRCLEAAHGCGWEARSDSTTC